MAGVIYQRACQWFADGSESESVALAGVNAAAAVQPNTLLLLRLAMDVGTAMTLSSPRIQICDQQTGTYVDLGNLGVSGGDGGTTPGGLIHDIACTNRLADNGNWQAGGKTTTLANGAVNNVTINGGSFINYLFAIQVGDIPGATRYFRLTHGGTLISYIHVAQLSVDTPLQKLSHTLLSGGLLSPLVRSLKGSL